MDWEESSLPVVTIVTTVALNINPYHFLMTTLPEKLIMKVAGENQVLTTMQILFSDGESRTHRWPPRTL
ncbi:hypothetical protein [uncultured Nostoc sp.]|uniref:hypothetical protein n=1 Tax=uncultured Nostoc sp. TaxID=340711 RepID=UPI0035C984AA